MVYRLAGSCWTSWSCRTIALSRPALESELNRTFQRYFDTKNGELNRWIGNHESSELTRAMHSNLSSFEDIVRDALKEQRERLLEQFSLANLRRLQTLFGRLQKSLEKA